MGPPLGKEIKEKVMKKQKILPAEEANEYRLIASEIIRLLWITGHRDQLDILRIQVWDAIKEIADKKPIIMKDDRIPCTHSTAGPKDNFCPKCMHHIG